MVEASQTLSRCIHELTREVIENRDWIEESYRVVAPKRLVAELDRRTSPPL